MQLALTSVNNINAVATILSFRLIHLRGHHVRKSHPRTRIGVLGPFGWFSAKEALAASQPNNQIRVSLLNI